MMRRHVKEDILEKLEGVFSRDRQGLTCLFALHRRKPYVHLSSCVFDRQTHASFYVHKLDRLVYTKETETYFCYHA